MTPFWHYTHGSAKSIGKAVSWILDGLLKPISYTPRRSCSDLKIQVKKTIYQNYRSNKAYFIIVKTVLTKAILQMIWLSEEVNWDHFAALQLHSCSGRVCSLKLWSEVMTLQQQWLSCLLEIRIHKLLKNIKINNFLIHWLQQKFCLEMSKTKQKI